MSAYRSALTSLWRQGLVTSAVAALLVAASPAKAQSDFQLEPSSSASYRSLLDTGDVQAMPSFSFAPKASPQYGGGNNTRYYDQHDRWSHLAIEAGGGFTAPVGGTGRTQTYGGNITLGAGWMFNKWAGMLA